MSRSKKKLTSQDKKKAVFLKHDEYFQEVRRTGPQLKAKLRQAGCQLPFYDLIDSNILEFARIAEWAKKRYQTLLDVIELEEQQFRVTDRTKFYPEGFSQISFDFNGEAKDYLRENADTNVSGVMNVLINPANQLRTIIFIQKNVPGFSHPEFRYGAKIAALFHEIGHVHDVEEGANFDISGRKFDAIEAEVFANLFALDRLAERQMFTSYDTLLSALKRLCDEDGIYSTVGNEILRRLPEHKFIRWQQFSLTK